MAAGDITVSVGDGALGIVAQSSPGLMATLGTSSGGTANAIYSFGDKATAVATLISGPLLEAVCYALDVAGAPQLAVPVTASNVGSAGAVTVVGTGPSSNVTITGGTPLDAYSLQIKIVLGGSVGTATFQYSLDGGVNFSATLATAASYAIAGTGISVSFAAATYVAGDVYSSQCVAPSFSASDLNAAITALVADPRDFKLVHIAGTVTGAGATAVTNYVALEAAVDAALQSAFSAKRFVRGILEVPDVTDVQAGVSSVTSAAPKRIIGGLGYLTVASSVTGRSLKRNVAFAGAARLSATQPARDPGAVADGSLPGVSALFRDETATPGGDDLRFMTARTLVGIPGYYISNGRTRALVTSDYAFVPNARVIDIACAVSRASAAKYLNADLAVDPVTGFIFEQDAQVIEADLTAALGDALVANRQATAASVRVSRTNNILATGQLLLTVRVTPRGYARAISEDIAFLNPATTPKAA